MGGVGTGLISGGWGGDRNILGSSKAQTQTSGLDLDGTALQIVTASMCPHLPFQPNPVPSQAHKHSFRLTNVTPTS